MRRFLALASFWSLTILCLTLSPRAVQSSSVTEQLRAAEPIECENLQAWYAGFNEEYFLGALPKNTIVTYGDPGRLNMAISFESSGRNFIVLSKELNKAPRVAHGTLIHEMVHIATRNVDHSLDGHGPVFQREMLRLAEAGAFSSIW